MNKIWLALPFLAVPLVAYTLKTGDAMSVVQIRAELARLATNQLKLKPVKCPLPYEQRNGNLCYAVDYDAEEFGKRVDALDQQLFRPITGWRDDYGVLSGVYQYRGQPYEVGFSFARPNDFWDQPQFREPAALKSRGYVSILVTDGPPRGR